MHVSYAQFYFFPYKFQLNENAMALFLYCTDSKGTNIFVKVIQWDKLWYDFPVVSVSHYGEQAVSFKMVNLPESLYSTCAHVYKITKWRPLQRTAATESCEWLLLTKVKLKL